VSTEGSTYSKTGDQVLIEDSGKVHGLISGGCLEGDLAERALASITSGQSAVVEYDLLGDDEVFGLGVGCDGKVRVLIQPLSPENEYRPFADMLAALETTRQVDAIAYYGEPESDVGGIVLGPIAKPGSEANTVNFRVNRPARVLIMGAGADVDPLLYHGHYLGWSTVVVDHRPHYIDSLSPPASCESMCIPVEDLSSRVDVDEFDVAIVMSHHLASDRAYLKLLAESDVPFVGLLGPPHRRDRLLGGIGECGDRLDGRLRAPVGREIGGRGPGAIALEIATEIHEHICKQN